MQPLDPMQLEPSTWVFIIASVAKLLLVFTLYMVVVAYTMLAERKVSAWIQDRHGPNRVGPWGLFQVLADGLKNFMKEETMPGDVNKPLFILAPALAFCTAMIAWAVIPFGAPLPTPWVRFWPEMVGLGGDFELRAAGFRQIVPVFTNVVYDTSQVHANTVFPHMFAWL